MATIHGVPNYWPVEAQRELPDADALPAYLDGVDFQVPGRSEGRRTEHREGHCIIRALRWLGAQRPSLFPATLARQEAPDFVLEPRNGDTPWACEITDAGETAYQHWLGRTADQRGARLIPSPAGDDWCGDAAEHAFALALGTAIGTKSQLGYWRTAPTGSIRCIVAYDQTNTAMFVSDRDAELVLASAVRTVSVATGSPLIGMLLRGDTRCLVAGVET